MTKMTDRGVALALNIRKACLGDATQITRFNCQLARETECRRLNRARALRGVTALLEDPAKGIYFIAEKDGRTAGQLLITWEWSDWRNGNFWWIQSVYVAPAFRGQGVFDALFSHVEKLANTQKDVCGLRLYVHENNKRAAKVYTKHGMRRSHYDVFEMDFVL